MTVLYVIERSIREFRWRPRIDLSSRASNCRNARTTPLSRPRRLVISFIFHLFQKCLRACGSSSSNRVSLPLLILLAFRIITDSLNDHYKIREYVGNPCTFHLECNRVPLLCYAISICTGIHDCVARTHDTEMNLWVHRRARALEIRSCSGTVGVLATS